VSKKEESDHPVGMSANRFSQKLTLFTIHCQLEPDVRRNDAIISSPRDTKKPARSQGPIFDKGRRKNKTAFKAFYGQSA